MGMSGSESIRWRSREFGPILFGSLKAVSGRQARPGMEIKTLEQLQAVDERTLHFTPWGLGRMPAEDSAEFQQRVIARLELALPPDASLSAERAAHIRAALRELGDMGHALSAGTLHEARLVEGWLRLLEV